MNSYNLKKAEQDIQHLVNRIAKMAGVDHKIEVYSSDAPHACFSTYKENSDNFQNPILIYNPIFLEQITSVSPWTVVAVFAQEIAAYYNNLQYKKYLLDTSENKKPYVAGKREIRADNFTGWTMWHEGARLKEATEVYELPRFSTPLSEAGRNERKKTMRAGWIKAYAKHSPLPKRKPKQDPPSESGEKDNQQPDNNGMDN